MIKRGYVEISSIITSRIDLQNKHGQLLRFNTNFAAKRFSGIKYTNNNDSKGKERNKLGYMLLYI